MTKSKAINITDYKILFTINYLNELNYYPSSLGVLKIVNGVKDEETEMFELCPTFQVLISYTQKKMTRDINKLVNQALIKRIYNEKEDDYFYQLTNLGEETLLYYKSHHRISFKKHEIIKRHSIIKIIK